MKWEINGVLAAFLSFTFISPLTKITVSLPNFSKTEVTVLSRSDRASINSSSRPDVGK